MAIRDLLRWFEASKAPAVLIGGVAIAILGRPRFTRDVDVVVLVDEID